VAVDLSDTPVVTIDLDILDANIERMQRFLNSYGIACRPHIKTHKNPAIAQKQVEAGAIGVTCQKLGEVRVMLEAGVSNILLAYNIVGQAKLDRLRRLAEHGAIVVVCDNVRVAKDLSAAFSKSGRELPVLIECDVGGGRNGVQSPAEAVDLARIIGRLPGLHFDGLMVYPITSSTGAFLTEARKVLESLGLPPTTVSTGGTAGARMIPEVPGVTEHRPGVYVFNDCLTVAANAATWEDCAMRVRSTIVSRPRADRAILDAGSKALSSDRSPATTPALQGFGRIVEYPDAVLYRLDEEHGYVDLSACTPGPQVGEIVSIIPNHACAVTNLHDELVGVRAGRPDTVFAVAARGALR
jgi:D-serine deaminase-like pyridoxal phosphate-dependent protein